MGAVIAVMGESGSGKSTSLRNLDPSTTVIIDADGKGLPWRGWRAEYTQAAHNYSKARTQSMVLATMKHVDSNMPEVQVLVIDTLNAIMVEEERLHKDEKGFDKWADLAWNVWDIVEFANETREDLTVVMLAHVQTETDEGGIRFSRIKTSGRKLSKLTLESKLQNLYHAFRDDGGNYVFRVRSANDTAKSSYGLFGGDEETVPNDMAAVVNRLREFEGLPPVPTRGAEL